MSLNVDRRHNKWTEVTVEMRLTWCILQCNVRTRCVTF